MTVKPKLALPTCPKCTRVDQITTLIAYTTEAAVPGKRRVIGHRCEACHHEW